MLESAVSPSWEKQEIFHMDLTRVKDVRYN